MLLQLWQVQVSELFNWSSMLLDLKYWWILWRWGQGWICCVMMFKAEYCEVMQRVLKLRLNGFKQVLVLYKKGAGALWLRMGQLLIRSLGAEIFFHSLSYIQIGRCQSIVNYKVFSPKLLWRNWTNQKLTEATIYNTIHQRWWQTWWWGWWKHQKRRGAGTPALGAQ